MTIKENLVFIFLWGIFFGFITRSIAGKYGVPYLFLYPEYYNHVSFTSYFLLGFSCGGFIMAFNVASYIINSFRFPFLATLERPFFTFILNNFLFPLVFLITYVCCEFHYRSYDNTPAGTILFHLSGFFSGVFVFLMITIAYFYLFDRNIFKVFGIGPKKASKVRFKKEKIKLGATMQWESLAHQQNVPHYADRTWYIETYLGGNLGIRLARGAEHYDHRMLERIFRQNHQTGAVFQVVAILSLLLLGVFRDNPFLMVPAGASVFLLFTIFTMLVSAIHNWLRGWTTAVVILALCGLNYLSSAHWEWFSARAFGMNYNTAPADYSYSAFEASSHDDELIRNDVEHTMGILDLWKEKNGTMANGDKPPFIILNTSGGGLRSAMWTFFTLQYLDSIYNHKLFKRCELITGSSGGMIGAAYYRELYLRQEEGQIANADDRQYLKKISNDILNPIAFTIATNDLAFRLQKFNDGKYTYTKDRAFAFEEKLDQNTDSVLVKRLRDYKLPEEQAIIPMMFITPTIVNDGRKLIISPQGLSFMTTYETDTNTFFKPLPQTIEFSRMFANQDAQNLCFTSALRMSATFPYITPITALPSKPAIEAMDAGLVDNFGLEEAVKFVFSFSNWLSENSSRIIIIQVRDQFKQPHIIDNSPHNLLESLTFPIDRFYSNLFPVENYKEDRIVEYMSRWYKGKINVVYFQMNNEGSADVSLSWHLTDHEKNIVKASMGQPGNMQSVKELQEIMK